MIDPDIRRARTLPASFYRSAELYEAGLEKVFARSWQFVGEEREAPSAPGAAPLTLLPGALDEPLLMVRGQDGGLSLLSNVCSHRGALLCTQSHAGAHLVCPYHGRRFDLGGRAESAPGFDKAALGEEADLPAPEMGRLGSLIFARLLPGGEPFDDWIAPVKERLGGLPIDELEFEQERAYEMDAHWAVYCDNYLEGLHIPFVHPALNAALDVGAYRTELLPHGVLQTGIARPGELAFEDRPGAGPGERIAAYYFWLFPNLMLNFYPWGLSLNHIRPLGPQRALVLYRNYIWDESKRGQGAGADVDETEREDQAVLKLVAAGLRSRLYTRGRFSPEQETGVHRFQSLLCRRLGL